MMSSGSASGSGSGSGIVTPFSEDSSMDTPTVISQSKLKQRQNHLMYYDAHELASLAPEDDNVGYYDDDELEDSVSQCDGDRPNRPSFLNLGLAGQSGSTPVVSRKPAFPFSSKALKKFLYLH